MCIFCFALQPFCSLTWITKEYRNKRNTLLLISVYILPLLCSDKEESMVKRDVSPLVSGSSLISSMTRPPLFTNKLRV